MIQGNAHISQQPTIAGWTLQEAPVHFTVSGHAEPSQRATESGITDTQRIDWLESTGRKTMQVSGQWVIDWTPVNDPPHASMRDAIDAAMRNDA